MIKLNNVRAGYDGIEILHGISLEVKSGESLSIIGPNGCGKTTLLRCIAGILPFSGEILINDADIRKLKQKELSKKVAMLSQMTGIYFSYTVFDTVMMGRFAHDDGKLFNSSQEIDEEISLNALKILGLSDLKDREINTLSGGQIQRVFLAKIIAQDPDVILLDEPTNHLDLSFQIELITFLKTLQKKGKTIIGVLHDINLAMKLSENVLLMGEGNVALHGKNKEVYSSKKLSEIYKVDIHSYMLETLEKWKNIKS